MPLRKQIPEPVFGIIKSVNGPSASSSCVALTRSQGEVEPRHDGLEHEADCTPLAAA